MERSPFLRVASGELIAILRAMPNRRGARKLVALRGAMALTVVLGVAPLAVVAGRPPIVEYPVALTATDALIMAGSGMPVVDESWMNLAVQQFIQPALGGEYTPYPVVTPAQFWPFTGTSGLTLDESIAGGLTDLETALAAIEEVHADNAEPDAATVIFGYSQSTVVAVELKRRLAAEAAAGESVPPVTFVLIANLARPNGGIDARFPGLFVSDLGWTFTGAAPTDTQFPTVDIARQYDPFADFPLYPENFVATANSLAGLLVHDYTPVTIDPTDPRYDPNTIVQKSPDSDTTYYLIPAQHLPLVTLMGEMGADQQTLDAIEPALRILVEMGYDRTIPYGEPTPARAMPPVDQAALARELFATLNQGQALADTPAQDTAGDHAAAPPLRLRVSRAKPEVADAEVISAHVHGIASQQLRGSGESASRPSASGGVVKRALAGPSADVPSARHGAGHKARAHSRARAD
ncbi:hypothetical protein BH09ACT8_BH09ACT8_07640 [soil metagenome]